MMKMQGDKLLNSATSSDKDGSIINPTTSFINEDEEESVSTINNKSTDNGEKSADPNRSYQNSNSKRNSTKTKEEDGVEGMKLSLMLFICFHHII